MGDELTPRAVTYGVPQGSVIGPALWNIFYDGLLEVKMTDGVQTVAFADDVGVIGVAWTGELAARLLNPALDIVALWMGDNGLGLAPEKSEAVVVTGKKKYDNPELLLEGHAVAVSSLLADFKKLFRDLSLTD